MSVEGKGFFKNKAITFTLPEGWDLLAMAEPTTVPGAEDVAAVVKEAIDNPVAMEKLDTLFPLENRKVAIIVDDQTRPTPAYQVLMPLIEILASLGVKDDDIDIVMGRGTHKVADEPTIRGKIGDEAYERFRFTMHDPDDASKLTYMGTTSRGNRVRINSVVAGAGLVIAIGLSNPHYFAGFGGGPKIMLPGVSSRETIAYNHHMISDPKTVPDVLEGNPIWEDMLEAARIAKLTMKIDVVMNQDQAIYKVFAGEVEAAQAAAVKQSGTAQSVGADTPYRLTRALTQRSARSEAPGGRHHLICMVAWAESPSTIVPSLAPPLILRGRHSSGTCRSQPAHARGRHSGVVCLPGVLMVRRKSAQPYSCQNPCSGGGQARGDGPHHPLLDPEDRRGPSPRTLLLGLRAPSRRSIKSRLALRSAA